MTARASAPADRSAALVGGLAAARRLTVARRRRSPAGALPVLETADATELAQALAEATEDQDVCYGWEVTVTTTAVRATAPTRVRRSGSGRPPTAIANAAECARWVIFEATITYTSALVGVGGLGQLLRRARTSPAPPRPPTCATTGIIERRAARQQRRPDGGQRHAVAAGAHGREGPGRADHASKPTRRPLPSRRPGDRHAGLRLAAQVRRRRRPSPPSSSSEGSAGRRGSSSGSAPSPPHPSEHQQQEEERWTF